MHRTRGSRTGAVLLVTPQPFYDDRGTPIAVEHTVRALSALGYTVDVLAFPMGEDVSIPRVTTLRSGNVFGFDSVPIGFSLQKCLLDISLLRHLERAVRKGRYQLVHAVEEAAYLACWVCRRAGIPFIYDMASSIPEELASKTVFRSSLVQSVLQGIEGSVLRNASHVVCSKGLGDKVRAQSGATPVSEWEFPSNLPPVGEDTVAAVRRELQLRRTDRVVMYTGNFAGYQGIDLLLDAFRLALREEPNLVLVCVGASEHEARFRACKLPREVANRVRVIERKPRKHIPAYFFNADCLVSLRPVSKNLPLKVFEYMAAGRPIVATRGLAHEPLLSSERAVLCEADPASIADGFVKVVRSPDLAKTLASNARTYARQQFSWSRFVGLIDRVYETAQQGSAGDSVRARRLSA